MNDDSSYPQVRAHLRWSAAWPLDEDAQNGPYIGPADEVCGAMAADLPSRHEVDANLLRAVLWEGCGFEGCGRWRQAIVFETPIGVVTATFAPPGLVAPRFQPGPLPPRRVGMVWTRPNAEIDRSTVSRFRPRLHNRIGRRLGQRDGGNVGIYLHRAVAVAPGAALHKIRLLPVVDGAPLGAVLVVVDRRWWRR